MEIATRFALRAALCACIAVLSSIGASVALATPISGMGSTQTSFDATGTSGTLVVDNGSNQNESLITTVAKQLDSRVEIWAFNSPFTGDPQQGVMLMRWDAARGGMSAPSLPLAVLTEGNYYLAVLAYAQTSLPQTTPFIYTHSCIVKSNSLNNAGSTNTQYCAYDVSAFDNLQGSLRCSSGKCLTSPLQPSAVVPLDGLWSVVVENTGQSGRGFQIEQRSGSLVLTYYGYGADGSGLWALAAGPMSGSTFIGDMYRYQGGTVLGGGYMAATSAGSVGPVTVDFTSPTTGTITLPGEAPKAISKFIW